MLPTSDRASNNGGHTDDPLESAATALIVVGILVTLASLIAGIALLTHSIVICTPSPYGRDCV